MILSSMDPDYVRNKRFQRLCEQCGGMWFVGAREQYHYAPGVWATPKDIEHHLAREDGFGVAMRRVQKNSAEALLSRSFDHDMTVNLTFMYDVVRHGDAGIDRVTQTMREALDIAWHRVVGQLPLEARRGRGGERSVGAVIAELAGCHLANDWGCFHAHLHVESNGTSRGTDGKGGTLTWKSSHALRATGWLVFHEYQAALPAVAKEIMGVDFVLDERGRAVDPTVDLRMCMDAGLCDRRDEILRHVMESGREVNELTTYWANRATRLPEAVAWNYAELITGPWADQLGRALEEFRERTGAEWQPPDPERMLSREQIAARREELAAMADFEARCRWDMLPAEGQEDPVFGRWESGAERGRREAFERVVTAAGLSGDPEDFTPDEWERIRDDLDRELYPAAVRGQGGLTGPSGPGSWVEGDPTNESMMPATRPTREEVEAFRAEFRERRGRLEGWAREMIAGLRDVIEARMERFFGQVPAPEAPERLSPEVVEEIRLSVREAVLEGREPPVRTEEELAKDDYRARFGDWDHPEVIRLVRETLEEEVAEAEQWVLKHRENLPPVPADGHHEDVLAAATGPWGEPAEELDSLTPAERARRSEQSEAYWYRAYAEWRGKLTGPGPDGRYEDGRWIESEVGPAAAGQWIEGEQAPQADGLPHPLSREDAAAIRRDRRERREKERGQIDAWARLGEHLISPEGPGWWNQTEEGANGGPPPRVSPEEVARLRAENRERREQRAAATPPVPGGPPPVKSEARRDGGEAARAGEVGGDAASAGKRTLRDRLMERLEEKLREVEDVLQYRRPHGSEDREIRDQDDLRRLMVQGSPAPRWFAHMKAVESVGQRQYDLGRFVAQGLDDMERAFADARQPTYRPDRRTVITITEEVGKALTDEQRKWLNKLQKSTECHIQIEGESVVQIGKGVSERKLSRSRDVEQCHGY